MRNFYDRIYLLLTLRKKEFKEQVMAAVGLSALLLAYSVGATFLGLYPLLDYYAVMVGIVLVALFYFIIGANRLEVDWDLLDAVEKARIAALNNPETEEEIVEEPEEVLEEEPTEEPTNESISMVEVEDDAFDFGDSIEDLYNKGTARQLADGATNSMKNKIDEMID